MQDPSRKFVDVASRHFSDRGLHGVSLSEIANELGLTKQSILYHFTSKQELFDTVMLSMAQRLTAMLTAIEGASVSDASRVGLLINAIYGYMRAHPQDARLIVREMMGAQIHDMVPLGTFFESCINIMHAHPVATKLPRLHVSVGAYQMIGAIIFFTLSEPGLNQLLGSEKLKSVEDMFLPILKSTWGVDQPE